jgi:hypothetical protein
MYSDQLRGHLPGPMVERLRVHPADGDNVCFIGDQHQFDLKQVDTWPTGQPPFLIENEDGIMRPSLPRQRGSAVGARSQVHVKGCRPPAACQEPVREGRRPAGPNASGSCTASVRTRRSVRLGPSLTAAKRAADGRRHHRWHVTVM